MMVSTSAIGVIFFVNAFIIRYLLFIYFLIMSNYHHHLAQ